MEGAQPFSVLKEYIEETLNGIFNIESG